MDFRDTPMEGVTQRANQSNHVQANLTVRSGPFPLHISAENCDDTTRMLHCGTGAHAG